MRSQSEPEARSLKVSGLDDVDFAETALSHVDGEAGRLSLRGHDVEGLAGSVDFVSVIHLLRHGDLPDPERHAELTRRLGALRVALYPALAAPATVPDNGMDYLRMALAGLDENAGADALIAATAVAAAVWHRRKQGLPLVAPRAEAGHAEDFLRMALGRDPTPAQAAGMDAYWVTVADHGMNASTFAARVVASTGSDLTSAVVAGIGALKGPLHGGAPGPVLDMLGGVGEPARAMPWLEAELAAGRRIMGMGHRIYRVRDPRAAVLERAIERLERSGVSTPRLSLARAVERAAAELLQARYPNRPLKANVEFYTAVLLDALGLPAELFSPAFAAGRVAGWCAHVDEQARHGRLVRPRSTYVGPHFPRAS